MEVIDSIYLSSGEFAFCEACKGCTFFELCFDRLEFNFEAEDDEEDEPVFDNRKW